MGIRNFIFGIKQRLMPTASGVDAQQIIMREVGAGKPLMVARFGAVEIKALIYKVSALLSPFLKTYTYNHIGNNAGFFPVNEVMLKKYAYRMLQDIEALDVLASWRPEELFFYQ